MRLPAHRLLLSIAALVAAAAHAERGMLSLDIAAGGVALAVPAPPVSSSRTTVSYNGSFWFGARYALADSLEVSLAGYFEPPATVWQNDVTVTTDAAFAGTLKHTFTRFGAQAGLQLVFGMVVRFRLGLELGWCQELYSGLRHYGDATNGFLDYGLTLADSSRPVLVLSPLIGLEWQIGDTWGFTLLPRAQLLADPGNLRSFTWAVVTTLQFSWGGFL